MIRLVTPLNPSGGRANLLATCRLAAEIGASVLATYVITVPGHLPLDAPLDAPVIEASSEALRAELIAGEYGISIDPGIYQARSIVDAVAGVAERTAADAICLAAPAGWLGWLRWLWGPGPTIVRRSSRPVLLLGQGWQPRVDIEPSIVGLGEDALSRDRLSTEGDLTERRGAS